MSEEEKTAKDEFIEALYSTFKSMKDGDDAILSTGLSNDVKNYVEKGQITTIDSSSISAGTVAGNGVGTMELDITECAAIILSACKSMSVMTVGGDAVLSLAIATGINTMCSAENAAVTKETGTITNSSGVVTPFTEVEAKGNFSGTMATIQETLTSAFIEMGSDDFKKKGTDGDQFLAEQIADCVTDYITNGSVSTSGTGVIEGASGIGAISFE